MSGALVQAKKELQESTGFVIPWDLIITLLLNLPCLKNKTPEKQKKWVARHPLISQTAAYNIIRDKSTLNVDDSQEAAEKVLGMFVSATDERLAALQSDISSN